MTLSIRLLLSLLITTSFSILAQNNSSYLVGYGKSDITYIDNNLGLFGYGSYDHRIQEKSGFSSRLYCRVISIKDQASGKAVFFLHTDLGAVFEPLRLGLVEKIKEELDSNFDDASLMMTASHTHCAPSGMSHYALYMTPTPGYHPELVAFTVDSMFAAFKTAYQNMTPQRISIKEGAFDPDVPVAFNRALKSYNKNQDIPRKYKKTETNLAINRNMPMMSFEDPDGTARGMLNWFGAHPIEMLPDHNYLNSASKGYAAIYAENEMKDGDVAIFAQSGAGDVMTVDGHNPKRFNQRMHAILCDTSFNLSYSCIPHSMWNGQTQAYKALEIQASESEMTVQGELDYEMIYIDLTNVQLDEEFSNGYANAQTSSPILGAAFLSGEFTWRDVNLRRFGLNVIADGAQLLHQVKYPFYSKEKRLYKKRLYAKQGSKRLIIDGHEKSFVGVNINKYQKPGFQGFFLGFASELDLVVKEILRQQALGALEEHTLLPEILPVQIIKIGNIAIAGIPTEITTTAHNRLQATIYEVLKEQGIDQVFISSYANEYAGYTTTQEEFLKQRYEGGHTLYGMHQLGAFQTIFKKLALEMSKPYDERTLDRTIKAPVFSKEELDKRSHLTPLK